MKLYAVGKAYPFSDITVGGRPVSTDPNKCEPERFLPVFTNKKAREQMGQGIQELRHQPGHNTMSDTPRTDAIILSNASILLQQAEARLRSFARELEIELDDAHNQITTMNQVIGELTDERDRLRQQLADANAAIRDMTPLLDITGFLVETEISCCAFCEETRGRHREDCEAQKIKQQHAVAIEKARKI